MLEIKRLSDELKQDFYRVHSEDCCGAWCFCSAWYVTTWEGFGDRSAEQNRQVREELFAEGVFDGYLVYIDGIPSGWVQVRQRDRFFILLKQFSLTPDKQVWAITCFALAPKLQGKGLSHEIIRLILADLRLQGISKVQAFPKVGEGLSNETIWTGPLTVFLKAGFKVIQEDDHRPVLEIEL
jgi:GNAT superfamily N-acetyltransferase